MSPVTETDAQGREDTRTEMTRCNWREDTQTEMQHP